MTAHDFLKVDQGDWRASRVAEARPLCFTLLPMRDPAEIDKFIAQWRDTGGSELANTQSFINGLCHLLGLPASSHSTRNALPRKPRG